MKSSFHIGIFIFRLKRSKYLIIFLLSFIIQKISYTQVNFNPLTCLANSEKFTSSLGDSVRTNGFSSFGVGYRISILGDTSFAIGSILDIHRKASNAFAIGNNITLNLYSKNAYAFGNIIGIGAVNAFAIGSCIKSNFSNTITIGLGTLNSVLMNSVEGSFIVSMNSTEPSLFVGNGNSVNIGKVGIGTKNPGSNLQVNGNCAIGFYNSAIAPVNGLSVNGDVLVNGLISLQVKTLINTSNGSILWDGNNLQLRRNNKWESLSYYGPWDTSANVISTMKNVTIGVVSPANTSALEINGSVHLHQIQPVKLPDGCIAWDGNDFIGRKNGNWVSLTGEGSGKWILCQNGIYTNNLRVGINTIPESILHIKNFEDPLTGIIPAAIKLETAIPTGSFITEIINDPSGTLFLNLQQHHLWQITSGQSRINNQLLINNTVISAFSDMPDLVIKREGENNYPLLRFEHSYENGGGGGGGNGEIVVNQSFDIIQKSNALTFRSSNANVLVDIMSISANRLSAPASTNIRFDGRLSLGCEPISSNKLTVDGNTKLKGDLSVDGNLCFNKFVGIGTSSPTSPLHIKGNLTEILLENTNNSPPNEAVKLSIASSEGCGRFVSDKDMAFFVDADNNQTGEGFYFISNSNYWGGSYSTLMMIKNEGVTVSSPFTVGTTANSVVIGYDGAHNYIESNNADLLINYYNKKTVAVCSDLSVGGNLGIGMGDTKGYKLAVDGAILTEKVKVVSDAIQWQDYVFYPDYQLMPLAELKKYITENNKLPDIPSESEVKANGIELAEMNALLLKKIEELTLYIIAQDNKINELNEQYKLIINNKIQSNE